LSKFKWGHSFYEVNKELLEIYSACSNGSEVVTKQNEYLLNEKEARCEISDKKIDFPPSDSDESSDEEKNCNIFEEEIIKSDLNEDKDSNLENSIKDLEINTT
jgi:pre-rRNA-processing protein TSR3